MLLSKSIRRLAIARPLANLAAVERNLAKQARVKSDRATN